LSQAWREASRDEPPASLDDAIRAAARQAVHAGPRPAAGSPFGGRWRVPLSVAAVLVVSATVTLLVAERDRHGPGSLHDQAAPPPAAPVPEGYTGEPAAGPPQTPARQLAERSAPAPVMNLAPRERDSAQPAQEESKILSSAPPPAPASAEKPQTGTQSAAGPVRKMPAREAAPVEADHRETPRAESEEVQAAGVAPAPAVVPPVGRAADSLRDAAGASADEPVADLAKREGQPAAKARQRAAAEAPPAAPTAMQLRAQETAAPQSEPQAFPAAPPTKASAERAAADTESLEPKAWLDRILELRRQGKLEEAARRAEERPLKGRSLGLIRTAPAGKLF
jgi:hypothetical protein